MATMRLTGAAKAKEGLEREGRWAENKKKGEQGTQ